MEVLAAPSTPDNPQAHPSIRRSFTLPDRLNSSPKSSPPAGAAGETDTLYTHHAARIVFFSPMVGGPRRHSSVEQGHSAQEKDPVGTLPWASLTERTIAAGKMNLLTKSPSSRSM